MAGSAASQRARGPRQGAMPSRQGTGPGPSVRGSVGAGSPTQRRRLVGAAASERKENTKYRVFVRLRKYLADEEAECKRDQLTTETPAVDFDESNGQIIFQDPKDMSVNFKGMRRPKKKYPHDHEVRGTPPFEANQLLWSFSDKQDWEREGRPKDRHDVERKFVTNEGVFQALDGPKMVEEVYSGLSHLVLATGASNTGKTHTMFGDLKEPGLVQQIVDLIMAERNTWLAHNWNWKTGGKSGKREPTAPGEEKTVDVEVRYVRIYQEGVEDVLARFPGPPDPKQPRQIDLHRHLAGKGDGEDGLADATPVQIAGKGAAEGAYESFATLAWGMAKERRVRQVLAAAYNEEAPKQGEIRVREKRAHYIVQVKITQSSVFRAEGEDDYGDKDEAEEKRTGSESYITLTDMGGGGQKPEIHDQSTHQKTVKGDESLAEALQRLRCRSDGERREVVWHSTLLQSVERWMGNGDHFGIPNSLGAHVTLLCTISPHALQQSRTLTYLKRACDALGVKNVVAPYEDKKLEELQEKAEEQQQLKVAGEHEQSKMLGIKKEMEQRQGRIYLLQYQGQVMGIQEWMLRCWMAEDQVRMSEFETGKGISSEPTNWDVDAAGRRKRVAQKGWPRYKYGKCSGFAGPHNPWEHRPSGAQDQYSSPPYEAKKYDKLGGYPLVYPTPAVPASPPCVTGSGLNDIGVVFCQQFPPGNDWHADGRPPKSLMVKRTGATYTKSDPNAKDIVVVNEAAGEVVPTGFYAPGYDPFQNCALRYRDRDFRRFTGGNYMTDHIPKPDDATPGIVRGGRAAKAGVQEGMYLIRVNNQPVHTMQQAEAAAAQRGTKRFEFGMIGHVERGYAAAGPSAVKSCTAPCKKFPQGAEKWADEYNHPRGVSGVPDLPCSLRVVFKRGDGDRHLPPWSLALCRTENQQMADLHQKTQGILQAAQQLRGQTKNARQEGAKEEAMMKRNEDWSGKMNTHLKGIESLLGKAEKEASEQAALNATKRGGLMNDQPQMGKLLTETEAKKKKIKASMKTTEEWDKVTEQYNNLEGEVDGKKGKLKTARKANSTVRNKLSDKVLKDYTEFVQLRDALLDKLGAPYGAGDDAGGDSAYKQRWTELWECALLDDGKATGTTDVSAALDDLLVRKMEAGVDKAFAGVPPAGVPEKQKTHYSNLRETVDKQKAKFMDKLQEHAQATLPKINDTAMEVGGQQWEKDEFGGAKGCWDASLRRIGDAIKPEAAVLKEFCEEYEAYVAKRRPAGASPTLAPSSPYDPLDATHATAASAMNMTLQDVEGGGGIAAMDPESIKDYAKKAFLLRSIVEDLTRLYTGRQRMEELWTNQVRNTERCLRLTAPELKDAEDGHMAGKPITDLINKITAQRKLIVAEDKGVSDAKAKVDEWSQRSKQAHAEKTKKTDEHGKAKADKARWEEVIKKQCCTVL